MSRYLEERRDAFGVEPICRVLGVPVSAHYARRSRKPSRRELGDQVLLVQIEAARGGYRRAYGARKTWEELRRRGVDAGRDRVARVMRQHGIEGKLRGGKRRTTIPDEAAIERARDLTGFRNGVVHLAHPRVREDLRMDLCSMGYSAESARRLPELP